MTDDEFDFCIPKNYYARVDGYNKKLLNEQRFARTQTFLLMVPHMDRKFNWSQFIKAFPLPGDERAVNVVPVMTYEMHERIQAAYRKK